MDICFALLRPYGRTSRLMTIRRTRWDRSRAVWVVSQPLFRDGERVIARLRDVGLDCFAIILNSNLPTAIDGREDTPQSADERP
jgi:hypothetical protein